MPLERDRLLIAEGLEAAEPGVNLEAVQRLCCSIDRWLAASLRLLQIGKVATLDAFVLRIVCLHRRHRGGLSHGLGRDWRNHRRCYPHWEECAAVACVG